MDRECQYRQGSQLFQRYCAFQIKGQFYGVKRSWICHVVYFNSLAPFLLKSFSPTLKSMQCFREAILKVISDLNKSEPVISLTIEDAIHNRLTHTQWVTANGLKTAGLKSHAEFLEQLCQISAALHFNSEIASDLLRLAEKRLFPRNVLTTESCFRRLSLNLSYYLDGCNQAEAQISWELVHREIQNLMSPLFTYFASPPFIEFLITFKTTVVHLADFKYRIWLKILMPLKADVEMHFEKILKALSLLPDTLRKKFRKEWSSLSLQELRQMNISKIKENHFNDCLMLVRPLLILADILGLLQKRYFQEKAAIIPPELADVMDLDGLEDILKELIQAKTPPLTEPEKKVDMPALAPIDKALPTSTTASSSTARHEEESAPVCITKTKALPYKKENRRGPSSVSETASSSSNSTSSTSTPLLTDSNAFEITHLTKSRLILKKLEQLGFFEERQRGSHVIMQNTSGAQVVVPNNSDMPIGTRRSIAKQVHEALS